MATTRSILEPVPILGLTLRQFIGGKSIRIVFLFSLVPAIFSLIFMLDSGNSTAREFFAGIFQEFIAPTLLPIATLILATNALTWLSGQRDDLREAIAAGGVVEVPLPSGRSGPLALLSPDGKSRPLPTGADRVGIGPLDRCGIWKIAVEKDGEAVAEVACNLANRRESDLRPAYSAVAEEPGALAGRLTKPAWHYLAVLALGLILLEWYLFQRRWIG